MIYSEAIKLRLTVGTAEFVVIIWLIPFVIELITQWTKDGKGLMAHK